MIDINALLDCLFKGVAATLSSYAFSMIFHTPPKERIFTGLTGGLGFLSYMILIRLTGFDTVVASFFAAFVLTWFARILSFRRKEPLTSYLVGGIFPIVPGAGIYYTAYHLFRSENKVALLRGVETIKIAVAIAIGIAIVLSLPKIFFAFRKQEPVASKPEISRIDSSEVSQTTDLNEITQNSDSPPPTRSE